MADIRTLVTQAKLEVANHAKNKTIELTKALADLQSNIREREKAPLVGPKNNLPTPSQSSSTGKG